MLNILQRIELYRTQQIEIQIDKHKHQLQEDPLLQCHLLIINTNLSLALKTYILQLLEEQKQLPLPKKNQLAYAFSCSFIPTNNLFISKFKQVKIIVEKININVLQYFKKVYDDLRNQQYSLDQQVVEVIQERDFSKCLCAGYQKLKVPKNTQNSQVYTCFLCLNAFHNNCLKYEQKESSPPFVCPLCILKNLDPLSKVDEILGYQILETKLSADKSATLTFSLVGTNQNQSIDIRCMRLGDYKYQQSWPDKGELLINGEQELKFQPMKINSSIKFRQDQFYKINTIKSNGYRIVLRSQSSALDERKLFQIAPNQTFIFAAFLIINIDSNQLIKMYQEDQQKWVSIDQMKDNIFQYSYINSQIHEDLVVKKISVSLNCQISAQSMKIPCRGVLCEHIQCFCLENFSKIMESITQRKWACPVCKRICLDFQIDEYQYRILQFLKSDNNKKLQKQSIDKQLQSINFDRNGHYLDNYIDIEENRIISGRNYLKEILQAKLRKKLVSVQNNDAINLSIC